MLCKQVCSALLHRHTDLDVKDKKHQEVNVKQERKVILGFGGKLCPLPQIPEPSLCSSVTTLWFLSHQEFSTCSLSLLQEFLFPLWGGKKEPVPFEVTLFLMTNGNRNPHELGLHLSPNPWHWQQLAVVILVTKTSKSSQVFLSSSKVPRIWCFYWVLFVFRAVTKADSVLAGLLWQSPVSLPAALLIKGSSGSSSAHFFSCWWEWMAITMNFPLRGSKRTEHIPDIGVSLVNSLKTAGATLQ